MLNFIRSIYNYKLGGNALLKEFSAYGLSTIVFHGSRILTELFVAKLIGPKLFGVWYLLNLLLTYRSVTYLGVVNGMLLKVPMLRGKQQQTEVNVYQNVSFLAVILSILMTAITLLSVSLSEKNEYTPYVYPLIFLFFANQVYYFIDALLIANSRFSNISKMQILCAIFFPCITIPLVYLYDLIGFMIGTSIAYLVASIATYLKCDLKIKLQFNLQVLKYLMAIGFPIMLVGIIYSFFITVDRWMIELMLGTEELGIFSMAILAFGTLTILPATMARQFYSKMAFDWGQTRSKQVLKDWCKKQAKYSFLLILATVLAVQTLFPLFIRYWLPNYEKSIPAILIISAGVLSMPFAAGWGDIINILGRQKLYIVISLVFIVVNILFTYMLIAMDFGIIGVALGTTLSFVLFNLAVRFTAQRILAHG